MKSKWKKIELGELATFYSGGTPSKQNQEYWGGDIPWITVKDMKEMFFSSTNLSLTQAGADTLRIMPADTIYMLVRGMGLFKDLPVLYCDRPATFNQDIKALVAKELIDPLFLAYSLKAKKDEILRLVDTAGHGTGRLDTDLVRSIPFVLPQKEEQKMIVLALQSWDEAIDKLDSLSCKLERLNRALRQKSFEKQFVCEKILLKASRIFESVSERARPDLPLLAVMQDLGVVRRDELDRRVAMPDGDISSYKVVRPGDFVISLRSFEGGLEYSNVLGLVSPAYTVLRPIREINSDYYRHFFKSRSFIGRLDKLIFGIRDGKQIAFRDFGDMRIPNPSIKVQESDAAALNQVASLLELNRKRKQAFEKQKRGLMQKLLTGEWRVKTDGGES